MNTKYSKSLKDRKYESNDLLLQQSELYKNQIRFSDQILTFPPRNKCVLCTDPLKGEVFLHRKVECVCCEKCGHLQTINDPPYGYPGSVEGGRDSASVYPLLSNAEFTSRKQRIYVPKLNWAIEAIADLGIDNDTICRKKWIELGCGGGYFLSALKDFGVLDFMGFDRDPSLISNAMHHGLEERVFSTDKSPAWVIENHSADVFVAFFTLEHLEDLNGFLRNIRNTPSGTIFLFSIPVLGFSTILENIFYNFYSRAFDIVMHTQLFTEKSLQWAMEFAGFKVEAEWIFGQDAEDFSRFLALHAKKNFPEEIFNFYAKKIDSLSDEFQAILDKNHLSDQRHILAIKS